MLTSINKRIRTHTTCWFGGSPSAPSPVKTPMAPVAAGNVNAQEALRPKPRGAGSTILTSGEGITNQKSKKTILGG